MKNRRQFIGHSTLGLFGVIGGRHLNQIDFYVHEEDGPINALYPTESSDKVRMVVGAAHANFDLLKELVMAQPELAKATYDWGFGDWESALGASSHMGRKDMAEFLMEHGARPNIFTWAMLGKVGTVKSIVENMPGVQRIPGPHGITLLSHAQMRLRRKNVEGTEKKQQEELVDYLLSLGDADTTSKNLDITKEEQEVYFGKYSFGDGADEFFEVKLNSRGSLSMGRGEYFGRTLLRNGEHEFAPGGAPSVRIHFEVIDGKAKSVTIHDPVPILTALRR